VLFHCFAGRPPFDDEHVGRLLMHIVRDPAPSLKAFRPDLPPQIIAAIDRSLARDPQSRWPTARAFADALSMGSAPVGDLDY
jgi:serine/threonine-protein kinase